MPTLSVIVITQNEARNIADCLDSVVGADQKVVLDSGSTDATLNIAAAHGAHTVVNADWQGFGVQKNRALALATGDWVLSLDADERITPALKEEILAAITHPVAEGFRLPRHSSFCGQFIDHSGWRPDYTLRLVRRDLASFTDHFLHAHMTVQGRTADLKSPIIHYSYRDLDDVLEKLNRYSRGAAIYEAAGATRSFPTPPYPSTHNLGSNRMSEKPADGVVNKWGQTHDIKNLFISDGSQFTTGAAENPTLTIVALALRQAEFIAKEMGQNTI